MYIPELYVQLSMIEKGDAIGLMPSSVIHIVNERNFKVKFLPFECENNQLMIERHIYFPMAYQEFLEEKILPLITHQSKCFVE